MGGQKGISSFQGVMSRLRRQGLLLLSDDELMSLTRLVTGTAIRGSWWSHARGRDIHELSTELAAHPDVLVTKLVRGKVTYVHKKLWSSFVAVARAGEDWQWRRVGPAGRALLLVIGNAGTVRSDALMSRQVKAAKELEKSLLVRGEQVHTAAGSHATRFESWDHWCERHGIAVPRLSPAQGRARLEAAAAALAGSKAAAAVKLPWT